MLSSIFDHARPMKKTVATQTEGVTTSLSWSRSDRTGSGVTRGTSSNEVATQTSRHQARRQAEQGHAGGAGSTSQAHGNRQSTASTGGTEKATTPEEAVEQRANELRRNILARPLRPGVTNSLWLKQKVDDNGEPSARLWQVTKAPVTGQVRILDGSSTKIELFHEHDAIFKNDLPIPPKEAGPVLATLEFVDREVLKTI